MGTRSHIGIVSATGQITSIYCHWDGYPRHHAPLLLKGYPDAAAVTQLLAKGDLSSLGLTIGERHPFDSQVHKAPSWCKFYRRDRGDKGRQAETSKNPAQFFMMLRDSWAEWIYLFAPLAGEPMSMARWWYRQDPSHINPVSEWKELSTFKE